MFKGLPFWYGFFLFFPSSLKTASETVPTKTVPVVKKPYPSSTSLILVH